MEEGNKNKTSLQKTREEKIPEIVDKLTMLIDKTLITVSNDFPVFKDAVDPETNEITVTAEQQLYRFMNVTKEAVSNANIMLQQVNELERELYDPNFSKEEKEEEEIKTSKRNVKDRARN